MNNNSIETKNSVIALFKGKTKTDPVLGKTAYVKEECDSLQIEKKGVLGDSKTYKGHIEFSDDRAVLVVNTKIHSRLRAFQKSKNKDVSEFLKPGGLGENICVTGEFTDDTVHVGDIFRIGEVILEVSMPRLPCAKNNKRHGSTISGYMTNYGASGFFCRVISSGVINIGDELVRESVGDETFTVSEILKHVTKSNTSQEILEKIAKMGIPYFSEKAQKKISVKKNGE